MRHQLRRMKPLLVALTFLSMLAVCLLPLNMAVADELGTGALFAGSGTETDPYLITSADDWNALSAHINAGGRDYDGKHFKLTNDIKVTTMLGLRPGSSNYVNYAFCGVFDGDGHTLEVALNSSGFVAPFAITHDTTIKNLTVTGTAKSSQNHATGLVSATINSDDITAATYLVVENVTVSVDVSCASHVAGVVGHAHRADITMRNVTFDGSISASSIKGGFIGWGGITGGKQYTANLSDCVFAGTYNSGGSFHPVGFQSGQGTVTLATDFYTTVSASGGSPVALTGSGQIKFLEPRLSGGGTEADPYRIASAADWITFAQDVRYGLNYAGKTVVLDADISASAMAGIHVNVSNYEVGGKGFRGVFDGQGHTLTVAIRGDRCASPFPFADDGAVFRNLRVEGSVTGSSAHASGLVGSTKGTVTFRNIVVAAQITSTHAAGFVGHSYVSSLNFENCVFCGTLNASSQGCAFVGWGQSSSDHTDVVSFTNCAAVGSFSGSGTYNPLGYTMTDQWLTVPVSNTCYGTGKKGSNTTKYDKGDANQYRQVVAGIRTGEPTVKNVTESTVYFTTMSDALASWADGTTLVICADVTTASTIAVSGNKTLDLGGHVLKAASAGYSVVTVGSGSALTIDDSAKKGGGKITGGSVGQNYGGGVTVDGGTLTLKGGAISGNANTYGGIGNCGGGVHVKNAGKFYMEGGEISGNTSYVGGGVCTDASATTVSITGGVIKNNKTDRFGSAIWAGRNSAAIFKIGGNAQIVDNISTWTGDKDGEGTVNTGYTFLMSGDPTIHGDWKTSGTSSLNTHVNLDNDGSGVQRIELDGALTNDSGTPKITVVPLYRWNDLANGQTFVFTKNWSQTMGAANPADYFKVDESVSGVRVIRKDGEAALTGSSDLGDLYVTFDANGGTGSMDAQLIPSSGAALTTLAYTREGYTFMGWNTKKDGTGTAYANGASIQIGADLTLYAQWIQPHDHDNTSFVAWNGITSLPTTAGNYYLANDVTLSSTWNVPGTTTLCLNGHGVRMTGSGSVVNVGSGASLTLCDCGTAEHRFSVASPASNGAGLATVDDSLTSGYQTFTGGYITGGTATHGGGIHVAKQGKLVFNGGTIIGNRGSFMGAGIMIENDNDTEGQCFVMNGGAVQYNYLDGWGAGICSNAGVRINGGEISYNYCTKEPAGLHCHYLYLSGGRIVNNYAAGDSFTAGAHADHEVFLSGDPVVTGNLSKGNPSNLDWDRPEYQHGHKINIVGKLSENAKIGVTLRNGGTGVFTSGLSGKGTAANFVADNSNYEVRLVKGEVYVGPAHTHDWAYTVNGGVITATCTGVADNVCDIADQTLTLAASGKTYDGTAVTATLTPSDGWTTANGLSTPTIVYSGNTDAGTYTASVTVGGKTASVSFTIQPKSMAGEVSATGYTGVYNGKAYGIAVQAPTGATVTYGTTADGCTLTASPTYSDASTYTVYYKVEKKNYVTVTGSATVVITPLDVTVTVTGHNATLPYDGQEHTVSGFDVSASTDLYDLTKDYTFIGSASVTRTDAGTTKLGLTPGQFTNTNPNFGTVTFEVTDGYLTITPIDVTVTVTGHNATLPYDGKEHTVGGYDVKANSDLYDLTKDYTFSGSASVTRTDAGTTKLGLTPGQFTNTNPNFGTVTFEVTDGYLTITPIDVTVTVTGHNATLPYDGQKHTVSGYDITASTDLYDLSKDYNFMGSSSISGTNAGTTKLGLTPGQFTNTNPNFGTVTFEVTDGYLTITPIDVTVTVTGHVGDFDYDGKEHSVSGYDAESSSPLYDVTKDFTFNGVASISRTNVSRVSMGLTADSFTNNNPSFKTVTFAVTDGLLTIRFVDAVVTTAPSSAKPVYNETEQKLILAGKAEGGTLHYALGKDDKTAPAEKDYGTSVPAATEVGNYYVWYKVLGDDNHNDLDPVCVKVTLADKGWVTLTGTLYQSDGTTPLSNAAVTLIQGNRTVDNITTDEQGGYWFTVPTGVYNVVASTQTRTATLIVSATADGKQDLSLPGGKNESELKVNTDDEALFGIAVGGLDEEANAIRQAENLSDDTSVAVRMTVDAKTATTAKNAKSLAAITKSQNLTYFDVTMEKAIDAQVTVMNTTTNVMEIAVPYDYVGKRGVTVYYTDGTVQTYKESDTRESGTFRVDKTNGLVYIYAKQFSTFAIGYTPYYHVESTMSFGSFEGMVTVVLTNLNDGETYTLENVDLNAIDFADVPKGEYDMTITWEDGVTQTLKALITIEGKAAASGSTNTGRATSPTVTAALPTGRNKRFGLSEDAQSA